MKRYVQTRANARSLDYDWLGEQPQRWWERYKQYTFFEHRTFIVEAHDQAWRLYASAIPSVRRDAVGTDIRHTVMLEGGISEQSSSEEALRVLNAALLHPDELKRALDDQFDEAFVARCLSEPGSYAEEVSDRLREALNSLPNPEIDPEPMSKGEVAWGGAESADGSIGLAQRAAALIAGASTGVAALLNLVSPSSVPEELDPDDSAALLVESSTASWSSSFPKGEPIVSTSGKPDNRTLLIKSALILLGLAAAGVVAYLIYRRVQSSR